jgi:Ni/Co efflux regulator RcnB
MRLRTWITLCMLATLILAAWPAQAQDRDRRDDRDDHHSFRDHDRDEMRGWYKEHEHHLPRGFRERDHLRPELEHRLVVHEVLAPELRGYIVAIPGDLYRRLPPPPRGYRYVVIGGRIVLLNNRSWVVDDVFDFDIHF